MRLEQVYLPLGWMLPMKIRSAGTRSNWYSMLSGLAITFGSIALMVVLLYHTVGQQFLTAVNGVSGDPTVYSLPNAPWWITLAAKILTAFASAH